MRKPNKPVIVLIASLLFLMLHSVSEARPMPTPPDSVLSNLTDFDTTRIRLSRTRVPTGILEDIGLTPVDLNRFNGQSGLADSNYVNYQTLLSILKGLSSSVVNGLTIPTDITSQMSTHLSYGRNAVGIVAYKYDRTHELEPNNPVLVDLVDGNYYDKYDAGGAWINPYEEKYVFAFSPYMNIVDSQVTYYFDTNLLFTNLDNIDYNNILFNPGDGNGFRSILNNTSFVNVTYTSATTPKELTLRVFLSDQSFLEAHSWVTVLSSTPLPPDPSSYDKVEFTSSTSYDGYQPMARITVEYANGTNTLVKPIIVAEGFDPFSFHSPDIFNYVSGYGFNTILTFKKQLETLSLTSQGYDIVYVDWYDSGAPIQANADILCQVIGWVNENKSGSNKNILIGQSMGGLIARYALCSMEAANEEHQVGVYVSHDSPHYGVNIPVGVMYAAQKILSSLSILQKQYFRDLLYKVLPKDITLYLGNIENIIDEIYYLRTAPSVKQMLIHYIAPNLQYSQTDYNAFQNELNALGFPEGDQGEGIINLALSNGGLNDYSSFYDYFIRAEASCYLGYITPSSEVLALLSTFLSNIGPGASISVYPALEANQLVYKEELNFQKQQGLLKGTGSSLTLDSFNAPGSPKVLESDAGSYYYYSDSLYRGFTGGNSNVALDLYDKFMFVPTVSSLAYKRMSQYITPLDREKDYYIIDTLFNQIPFDGYRFFTRNSSYHTSIGASDIIWINNLLNLSISVPRDTLYTGDQLSVLDSTSVNPVNARWSVASPSVARIEPLTGNITVESGGYTTVFADINNIKEHYRLSKEIFTSLPPFPGFPSYSLAKMDGIFLNNGDFSGDYTIKASPSASIDTVFTKNMICHWGQKDYSFSSIQWTTAPYNLIGNKLYHDCNFPELADARMIYFYVSYGNQVSSTYSIYCRIPPGMIILDGNGNLYTEDMDTPFAQVKGDISNEYYYFCCVDKELVYDHWPTWAEFCTDMLTSEAFVAQIKTTRPWGDEELVMIPYSYHTTKDENEEYGFLTIKFDETL